jgi:hypothetical protein
MPKLIRGVAALVAVASVPVVASAQSGLAIDHKAVECIVQGKFPKMNSCFAPAADVARARVYFRPEGVESWYYVDMKSDAPCLAGVLPRPRKELVGKHINYYVQVTDKSFNESRTSEYNPIVVNGESECKDKPVAPFLSKASVQVFPGLPAGMAAGAGAATLPIVGGAVLAGGAAAGVAAASGDDDSPTTTRSQGTTPTTLPGTTATTGTTQPPDTTAAPSEGFQFSFHVSPKSGVEPLKVSIDMCGSKPKGDRLRYSFNFDGGNFDMISGQDSDCKQTRTLSGLGVAGLAPPTTNTPKPKVYNFTLVGCAEMKDNSAPQACDEALVKVTEAGFSGGATATVRIKPKTARPSGQAAPRRLSWNSELVVDGGAGQVIANGQNAVFAGRGRSSAIANGRRGDNRIEAQLVQGSGRPGTWKFEMSGTSSFQAGSLRVIAGEVAQITGDSITFRLKGTPGERVVFSFKTER